VKLLTIVTVGFLLLNATLLAWAGVGMRRPWLLALAGAFVAASVLVVLALRRYRRIVAELQDDRREMKRDVESLRELLNRTQR
jgi:membrane protein implicated in regulation of membrane protease activity